jgi:hypothetical protein
MEWFTQLGNYLQFMPNQPALAFDMMTSGPKYTPFGYTLAYNMQNSPTGLEIYPPEGAMLPGGE